MKNRIEELEAKLASHRDHFHPSFPWKEDASPEYLKEYRKERRLFKKLEKIINDELIKLSVQKFRDDFDKKHAELKAIATDPRLQKLTDLYHKMETPYDYDDYDYGNWQTDIRMCMLEWYMKVKNLEDNGFNLNSLIAADNLLKTARESLEK